MPDFEVSDLVISGQAAVANSRFCGILTALGAPTSGTWTTGDSGFDLTGQMFFCTAGGTPGTWIMAPLDPDNLTAEVTSMRRGDMQSTTLSYAASQSEMLTFATAKRSFSATNIFANTGSTAAGATPTHCWMSLYSVAANGNGTLIASCADDTTLFAATNTSYSRALTGGPFAITAGLRYAFGVLIVTAAALPTFEGAFGSSVTPWNTEQANAPRRGGQLTGQSTVPGSFTDAGLTASGRLLYMGLT